MACLKVKMTALTMVDQRVCKMDLKMVYWMVHWMVHWMVSVMEHSMA